MAYCVHQVPGRVRFKVPQLPRNEACAMELEKKLLAINGVLRVEINQHASSVTVHHNAADNPIDELLNHIRLSSAKNDANGSSVSKAMANGDAFTSPRRNGASNEIPRALGQVIGQAIFATLVQSTLKRGLLSILIG